MSGDAPPFHTDEQVVSKMTAKMSEVHASGNTVHMFGPERIETVGDIMYVYGIFEKCGESLAVGSAVTFQG